MSVVNKNKIKPDPVEELLDVILSALPLSLKRNPGLGPKKENQLQAAILCEAPPTIAPPTRPLLESENRKSETHPTYFSCPEQNSSIGDLDNFRRQFSKTILSILTTFNNF